MRYNIAPTGFTFETKKKRKKRFPIITETGAFHESEQTYREQKRIGMFGL